MAASIRQIRPVFMHEWDPIGVGDEESCQDEYDAYVMPVYSILRQDKGRAALTAYLAKVYEDIMGLRVPSEEFSDVAQKLLQIDVSHDEVHR
jgi:hypothetical protein